MSFDFALNRALDAPALAQSFAADGYVSIPDFLADDGAVRLHTALSSRNDWAWAINAGGNVYDLGPEARGAMTEEQRAELEKRVNSAARDGFQFRFSSLRVPDPVAERRPEKEILHAFAEFMRSEQVIELLREVTGRERVIYMPMRKAQPITRAIF